MKRCLIIISTLFLFSVSMFAKNIAIIGAMESEIVTLKNAMTEKEESVIAGVTYYIGKLEGKNVVLFKSGVGKVNAAMATTIALEKFDISSIIFTGVAGSADPAVNIGDIVVSSYLVQHDYDTTANGKKLAAVPGSVDGKFIADKKLVDMANKAAVSVLGKGKVKVGVIATGDQFVASKEKVKWLRETFNASAVEMEGAAVAQVAILYKVPFVVIRSMSDKADDSAHMNFNEFVILASENSMKIVKAMLKNMK